MKTQKNINNPAVKEREILNAAKLAFEEATGFCITILEVEPAEKIHPDAVLQIDAPDVEPKKFRAEIKGFITKATIGHVVERIRRFGKPGILVTRHVTPPMAEKLKELNIAFIDTAGNAYINELPFFVYIIGQKKKKIPATETIVRAFRPTGLKVVFALLCLPELVKAPYRDIARAANVALGTVGWVMYDLRKLNFLVDRGKHGRKLINTDKLLDTWIHAYARELRPKLYIGHYNTTRKEWWEKINLGKNQFFLGGEPAAARLTDYLKPETITIYGPEEINKFLIVNHLKKDPQGKIEIFQKFWNFDYPWNYKTLVPPLLIYADLIATADDRNIETARIIYDQYIDRLIEKY
ncbi:MAG: hypothetical protein LWX51_08025 [Deltaproteobacteria bacterium]|jgi:hypothetical protein|nr:hypothetical protein [Deltaproteobacteria bacterium]